MAVSKEFAKRILARLLRDETPEVVIGRLQPRFPKDDPLPPSLPRMADQSKEQLEKRRCILKKQGMRLEQLTGKGPEISPEELVGSIENFVGFSRTPVGIIGPLRVNGFAALGDFYVPMATTEGALVASYQRGANLISQTGGVSVMCTTEAVSRAPCFVFRNMREVGTFMAWAIPQFDSFQEIVCQTSKHCKVIDVRTAISGKEVYLIFEYTTGDAAGQNMVTIATEAICNKLVEEAPVKPQCWYLEGNFSGDKKATMLSFMYARGKKVVAEAIIPAKHVKRFIHAEPVDLVRYWETSMVGGIQSGSIGVQGHYANALAAIFIACGQDVACVAEASVGVTRMDVTSDDALYVSVALPNVIVGTVGGGTYMPTAKECLEMMGCYGAGKAQKFAEIVGAATLAGEVSIVGALAAGEFGRAHTEYGRKPASKKPPSSPD